MRTLIYKRTHKGDPGPEGWFGIHDCMGPVREWGFEAVIGVGGISAKPVKQGLAEKVNWIGIGARKTLAPGKRGPDVTFEHFRFYGSDGPRFQTLAPQLADRMLYSNNVRVLMNDLNQEEQGEVEKILDLARNHPPSFADAAGPVTTSNACVPRTPSAKSIKGCSS